MLIETHRWGKHASCESPTIEGNLEIQTTINGLILRQQHGISYLPPQRNEQIRLTAKMLELAFEMVDGAAGLLRLAAEHALVRGPRGAGAEVGYAECRRRVA